MPTLNSGTLKTYCECPVEGTGGAPESMYSKEELPGRVHDPGQCHCTAGYLHCVVAVISLVM
jgi:hypothetical protein